MLTDECFFFCSRTVEFCDVAILSARNNRIRVEKTQHYSDSTEKTKRFTTTIR